MNTDKTHIYGKLGKYYIYIFNDMEAIISVIFEIF